MNHRYFQRVELVQPVELWLGGKWCITQNTTNVSLEGLFIKAGPFSRQDLIELRRNPMVRLCVKHLGKQHCMSALVVHRTGGGVGLMLAPPAPAYIEWVSELLDQESLQQIRNLPELLEWQGKQAV